MKRCELDTIAGVPRISAPLTVQHVADCVYGQRMHSSECWLTTDHNGEARVMAVSPQSDESISEAQDLIYEKRLPILRLHASLDCAC